MPNPVRDYRASATDVAGHALQRAPDPTDEETPRALFAVVEIIVDVLSAYDLRGDDAVHAVRGLRSLLHGFVVIETAGGFGLPLDLDESFSRLVATFVAGLRSVTPTTGVKDLPDTLTPSSRRSSC